MTLANKTLGLLVAGALTLSACNDDKTTTDNTTSTTASTNDSKSTMSPSPGGDTGMNNGMNNTTTASAATKMTDADFVMQASAMNMAEINAHKAGVAQGGAEVKKHAKMMLTDHQAMGNDMKALASKKSMTLATDAPPEKKQMLAGVTAKKGSEFDMAYLDAQESDHKEAIALFQRGQNDVQDADLKALITKTIPKLEGHLKMVQDAKGKMGSGAKM